MALLWRERIGGDLYEVRNHGATIRLYSNGVFHSQWNPRDPLKGSLWELLFLPAFFLPREQLRSVLLLGVGGGALIRLLQHFMAPTRIVGVDLDATHLQVARQYFGVRDVDLVHANAIDYVGDRLAAARPERFDLVIDDLFGHASGEAERSVRADRAWCERLLDLTEDDGMVIGNFGSRRELLASGWRHKALREQLQGGWTADLPSYENSVIAVSRKPLSMSRLVEQAPPAINPRDPRCRLASRLRRLP